MRRLVAVLITIIACYPLALAVCALTSKDHGVAAIFIGALTADLCLVGAIGVATMATCYVLLLLRSRPSGRHSLLLYAIDLISAFFGVLIILTILKYAGLLTT